MREGGEAEGAKLERGRERGKKNKGKKERWRREVDGTEGGGTGCRPKENVKGGWGGEREWRNTVVPAW